MPGALCRLSLVVGSSLFQLVQHIPEASLSYQKVPPGSAALSDLDANMNEPESRSKHQRLWKPEEVSVSLLQLHSDWGDPDVCWSHWWAPSGLGTGPGGGGARD